MLQATTINTPEYTMSVLPALLQIPAGLERDCHPPLKIPAYLDGDIEVFEFNENNRHGSYWFFKMLDELQGEYDDAGGGSAESFIHNKAQLLTAWNEHRMFGLKMSKIEKLHQHHSYHTGITGTSPMHKYLWTNLTAGEDDVQYAFPVFCVLKELEHHPECGMDTAIEYLWVAKRVRGIGLGCRMVREMCCDAVLHPMRDAVKFWNKLGYQELCVVEKKRKIGDF